MSKETQITVPAQPELKLVKEGHQRYQYKMGFSGAIFGSAVCDPQRDTWLAITGIDCLAFETRTAEAYSFEDADRRIRLWFTAFWNSLYEEPEASLTTQKAAGEAAEAGL